MLKLGDKVLRRQSFADGDCPLQGTVTHVAELKPNGQAIVLDDRKDRRGKPLWVISGYYDKQD